MSASPGNPGESNMRGTTKIPFTELVRDTIETHGLVWATEYYYTRMPAWEARIFIRAALGL